MLEDMTTVYDAGASETTVAESDAALEQGAGARWLSLSGMCSMANADCSLQGLG